MGTFYTPYINASATGTSQTLLQHFMVYLSEVSLNDLLFFTPLKLITLFKFRGDFTSTYFLF
jgi:hypothetical protein